MYLECFTSYVCFRPLVYLNLILRFSLKRHEIISDMFLMTIQYCRVYWNINTNCNLWSDSDNLNLDSEQCSSCHCNYSTIKNHQQNIFVISSNVPPQHNALQKWVISHKVIITCKIYDYQQTICTQNKSIHKHYFYFTIVIIYTGYWHHHIIIWNNIFILTNVW